MRPNKAKGPTNDVATRPHGFANTSAAKEMANTQSVERHDAQVNDESNTHCFVPCPMVDNDRDMHSPDSRHIVSDRRLADDISLLHHDTPARLASSMKKAIEAAALKTRRRVVFMPRYSPVFY